jgi:hypothetical protein
VRGGLGRGLFHGVEREKRPKERERWRRERGEKRSVAVEVRQSVKVTQVNH